jgi:hypothetical protein
MREDREPWLELPDKNLGEDGPRCDPRFRTHVVATTAGGSEASALTPTDPPKPKPAPRPLPEPTPPKPVLGLQRRLPEAEAATPARRLAPRVANPPPPGKRGLGAPPLALSELPLVSSADWVDKVGEAAKIVDVVVVFYRSECVGSDMFELAFHTVVNEMLPQAGRPYTAYRFSLDVEPDFVSEMAESLGLPPDNPVTDAGFAWCGPGRRLFLVGDRALGSRAAFSRFVRRSLAAQQVPLAGENGPGDRDPVELGGMQETLARSRAPLWGGRALPLLAWFLFGTTALGAAAVGVAPQWAHSLWHPAKYAAPKDSSAASSGSAMPGSAVPPVASLDNPDGGSPANSAQAPTGSDNKRPAAHAHPRKKHSATSLSWGAPYLSAPERGR